MLSHDQSCDACFGRCRRRLLLDRVRPAVAALGNDDSEIVGQRRSCLTGRPASIFLSAAVTDPEEQQRDEWMAAGVGPSPPLTLF